MPTTALTPASDGVWEATSAELHMAVREQMGREASPVGCGSRQPVGQIGTGRSSFLQTPHPKVPSLAAEIGSAERLDVADQIIDFCPCQRQIRHRTVRMR